MSSRISLLSTGEDLLTYLNTNLSAGVFLEHNDLPQNLYNHLEDNFGAPDIVVLGLNAEEPIRTAEHILVLRRDIKIVILCKDNRQNALQKAIQFSPFLNSDVVSFEFKNNSSLRKELQTLVNNVEKQRLYKTAIAVVEKERTAISPTRPLVANYLDTLLDVIPIGIINLDSHGRLLNLNRSAQELIGRSERELVNSVLHSLFSHNDTKNIQTLVSHALLGEEEKNNSIVVSLNSLKQCYIEISISLLAVNTAEPILTTIIQEVTDKVLEEIKRKKAEKALKASEQQLRLVIDSIPELIAYVDADLAYQFNNKAFEKWFGFSRDQIKGKKIWEVIGDLPYSVIKPYIKRVMSGEVITFEEKLNYPYRGTVYIRSTYVPNFSEGGVVIGFFLLTADITQSKSEEESKLKHMLEAAHASRIITIGEMSTQLAHEISQPLASIEAYSSACVRLIDKDRADIDELHTAFKSISGQAIRAQEIMHELRNFVKKDTTRKDVAINDLVQNAIKFLQIEIREHEPDLHLDLANDLPLILADQVLIEQVIVNLVKNAMEAMQVLDKNARRLTLKTNICHDSGIFVSVRDSGPGISDYEAGKIFEPFYTTKPEGMGMGLAIIRSIIDSHGGELDVQANESVAGTTFKFTLPLRLNN
jgi:two-component system sensor kinase FixL